MKWKCTADVRRITGKHRRERSGFLVFWKGTSTWMRHARSRQKVRERPGTCSSDLQGISCTNQQHPIPGGAHRLQGWGHNPHLSRRSGSTLRLQKSPCIITQARYDPSALTWPMKATGKTLLHLSNLIMVWRYLQAYTGCPQVGPPCEFSNYWLIQPLRILVSTFSRF